MFLSTIEKQLDAKRRIVLPQNFRAAAAGGFDGIYCFPSLAAECVEAGGQAFLDAYNAMIAGYPFGHQTRRAYEHGILADMVQLGFDAAGRITLSDELFSAFAVGDWVSLVGLGDRFEIWPREAYKVHRARQRELAREALFAMPDAVSGG